MISKQLLLTRKVAPAVDPNTLLMVQGGSIIDQSLNHYVGTLQGTNSVVPTGGKFNNGYLDFTNGRLNFDLPNITTDFYVETWVQLKSNFNGTWCHLVGKGNGLNQGTWVVGIQNRQLTFAIGGSTTSNQFAVRGTSTLVASQWYHLAASKVGSSYYVFVNGVRENTGTSVYSIINTAGFSIADRRANDMYLQYPTAGLFGGMRIALNGAPPTANFTPPTGPWTS